MNREPETIKTQYKVFIELAQKYYSVYADTKGNYYIKVFRHHRKLTPEEIETFIKA